MRPKRITARSTLALRAAPRGPAPPLSRHRHGRRGQAVSPRKGTSVSALCRRRALRDSRLTAGWQSACESERAREGEEAPPGRLLQDVIMTSGGGSRAKARQGRPGRGYPALPRPHRHCHPTLSVAFNPLPRSPSLAQPRPDAHAAYGLLALHQDYQRTPPRSYFARNNFFAEAFLRRLFFSSRGNGIE